MAALLREAGDLRAPHRVAHYLEDLAATYHKWYNVERVVPMELTEPEARGEQGRSPAHRQGSGTGSCGRTFEAQ